MSTNDTETTRYVDNVAGKQYEAYRGGALAGLAQYHVSGDTLAVMHTETEPGFEGKGVASGLVGYLVADVRRRGLHLAPYCPFVRTYLRRHPDDLDLVPEDRRGHFEL